MEFRSKALIGTLAASFIAMVLYLASQHGAPVEFVVASITFGVALIGGAYLSQKSRSKSSQKPALPKIVFASFGLAFALMLLSSIIALPFVGFSGFLTILGPNVGAIWVGLAVAVSPFAFKYLR
ncbi:MAG: hypothetical protein JAZ18_10155 [Candidatus Thiodiazotropha endolucinida]|nr:hypothetical protein [Candidatus Thiodiazotropha endolucinida]